MYNFCKLLKNENILCKHVSFPLLVVLNLAILPSTQKHRLHIYVNLLITACKPKGYKSKETSPVLNTLSFL
jgi:hypothetical protein